MQQAAPGAQLAALGAVAGAVAAAIQESQRQLGCAKCRYAVGGCKRCRNPAFKPRVSPAAASAQQAAGGAAGGGAPAQRPAARRVVKGKRQRRAPAAEHGSGEPLVHALRRQLQQLHAQSSSSIPSAAPPPPAEQQHGAVPAADAPAHAGTEASVPAPDGAGEGPLLAQQQQPQQPQPQQQKRAAEAGGAAAAGRPAKFFKADPLLAASLGRQPQAAALTSAGASKRLRQASSEPSPPTRRPAKRQRAAQATLAAGGEAAGQAKRPAAAEQQQRPAKFRRVGAAEARPGAAAAGAAAAAAPEPAGPAGMGSGRDSDSGGHSSGSGSGSAGMEIDPLSPRKRAAAAALERAASVAGGRGGGEGGSPGGAAFLARLEESMQLRHQERQAGGSTAPNPLSMPTSKRYRGAARSPVGSQGAAASLAAAPAAAAAAAAAQGQEPDPRLCLWEPPVSPFGLLEEELYDDPWKLLVACMLLNKTTGTQVRKVIWDLFRLCPTPAAAVAADVEAVQALIQPLGLFRKRALAIQQLSQEYLYKEWRDPTELYGIGKYAADAYHMFCRGRWQAVQPEDKDLKRYRDWLESTGGLGTGLTRHRTVPLPAAAAAGGSTQ